MDAFLSDELTKRLREGYALMAAEDVLLAGRSLAVYSRFRRDILHHETGELRIPRAFVLARIFMPGYVDAGVKAKKARLAELEIKYQHAHEALLQEREDRQLPPLDPSYIDCVIRIVAANPGGFEGYASSNEALDRALAHLQVEMLGGPTAERHEEWPRLTWYLGADPDGMLCWDAPKIIPRVTEKMEDEMEEWFDVDPCNLDVAGRRFRRSILVMWYYDIRPWEPIEVYMPDK